MGDNFVDELGAVLVLDVRDVPKDDQIIDTVFLDRPTQPVGKKKPICVPRIGAVMDVTRYQRRHLNSSVSVLQDQ